MSKPKISAVIKNYFNSIKHSKLFMVYGVSAKVISKKA